MSHVWQFFLTLGNIWRQPTLTSSTQKAIDIDVYVLQQDCVEGGPHNQLLLLKIVILLKNHSVQMQIKPVAAF